MIVDDNSIDFNFRDHFREEQEMGEGIAVSGVKVTRRTPDLFMGL